MMIITLLYVYFNSNEIAILFRPGMDVISVREGTLLARYHVQHLSREPQSWKCLCIEGMHIFSNFFFYMGGGGGGG